MTGIHIFYITKMYDIIFASAALLIMRALNTNLPHNFTLLLCLSTVRALTTRGYVLNYFNLLSKFDVFHAFVFVKKTKDKIFKSFHCRWK